MGKIGKKGDFQFYEKESTLWNGSIFSGMPDFVGAPYKGATALKKVYNSPMKLGIPRLVTVLFWYMIGFYILLLTLGLTPQLSTGGAVAFTLSSYNIIIILAGHYMKVSTLALIPPALAGIILCFNKKYIWGFILTAFSMAMMIAMAHIQMIYYFLLALLLMGAIEVYHQIKEKTLLQFSKTIAVIIVAAAMAILPNYSRLINYYKYNDQSIRGSSELTLGNEEVRTKKGLDKDYINSWSSGVSESMMSIVPDVKGGRSGQISQDRDLMNKIPRQYRNIIGNFNQYWGEQPFTGGPNYLGVVFSLLFLLGLFTIKGKFKWWFLIPVLLFHLLSLGGNFSIFTDLFIHYVPMYNKFRAPVSILAISAIFLSLFAIYTLFRFYSNPEYLDKKIKFSIIKSPQPVYLIVSAGFLLFLLINIASPELFNSYISSAEQIQFDSLRNQPNVANQLDGIIATLTEFRIGVFKADLWRAFILAGLITGLLFFYSKKKINKSIMAGAVIFLAIFDFWGVSRRYVSIDSFQKTNMVETAYKLSEIDNQIYQTQLSSVPGLKDKYIEVLEEFQPKTDEEKQRILTYAINKYSHYRVFNSTQNVFQENFTSAAHRSVGGYHAVKLRRYQDLIEHQLGQMNRGVINMLNTKYYITQNGLQENREAMGVAWFVDSIKWVDNPNDEISALDEIEVSTTAIMRSDMVNELPDFSNSNKTGSITMETYTPDRIQYSVEAPENKLVVFSEIFYPDWKFISMGKKVKF